MDEDAGPHVVALAAAPLSLHERRDGADRPVARRQVNSRIREERTVEVGVGLVLAETARLLDRRGHRPSRLEPVRCAIGRQRRTHVARPVDLVDAEAQEAPSGPAEVDPGALDKRQCRETVDRLVRSPRVLRELEDQPERALRRLGQGDRAGRTSRRADDRVGRLSRRSRLRTLRRTEAPEQAGRSDDDQDDDDHAQAEQRRLERADSWLHGTGGRTPEILLGPCRLHGVEALELLDDRVVVEARHDIDSLSLRSPVLIWLLTVFSETPERRCRIGHGQVGHVVDDDRRADPVGSSAEGIAEVGEVSPVLVGGRLTRSLAHDRGPKTPPKPKRLACLDGHEPRPEGLRLLQLVEAAHGKLERGLHQVLRIGSSKRSSDRQQARSIRVERVRQRLPGDRWGAGQFVQAMAPIRDHTL